MTKQKLTQVQFQGFNDQKQKNSFVHFLLQKYTSFFDNPVLTKVIPKLIFFCSIIHKTSIFHKKQKVLRHLFLTEALEYQENGQYLHAETIMGNPSTVTDLEKPSKILPSRCQSSIKKNFAKHFSFYVLILQ